MKTDKSFLKAGAFVAFGLIIFFVSVLNFGGKEKFFASYFELKAEYPSTQGLAPGSVVSLAGLPIGNVAKLDVHPDRPTILVSLKIEKRFQERIKTDAIASVKTQGALGDRYIYIEAGSANDFLKDGATIQTEEPVDFLEILSQKTKDTGNIGDLIKEIHNLFKNLNEDGRSAKLMQNLASSSGDLKILLADQKTKDSLARINNILKKIDQGDGTLGRLVNDPTLYDKLLKMLGESPRNQYFKSLVRESVKP